MSEYSESWVSDFMTVAQPLVSALDGHGGQGIEHIGSTAVPGMVARPIIDVAVIAAPLAMQEATTALTSLGYVPEAQEDQTEGSDPVSAAPHVRRFMAPTDAVLHSLTLFDEDSPLLHAAVATRQVLMTHEALAAEFAGYKRGLAFTGEIDVEEYRAAKAPMFAKILAEAGMGEAEVAGLEWGS